MIKVVVVSACLLRETRVTDQDGSVRFLRWQEEKYVDFLGKQVRDFAKKYFAKKMFSTYSILSFSSSQMHYARMAKKTV